MSGLRLGHGTVSDPNFTGREDSEFPIVCETCLGDNPYVKMTKQKDGTSCKICERALTLFKWKAGTKGRYKTTMICQHCARAKNCCQTCLFDLDFGLPVQVRDKFLADADKVDFANSRVGKDYQIQNFEAKQAREDRLASIQETGTLALQGPTPSRALPQYEALKNHPVLKEMARKGPYYRRNEARVCSFFVKGTCNRGETCPFKHEMPKYDKEHPMAKQRILDRYHGKNDPMAMKILEKDVEKKEEEGGEEGQEGQAGAEKGGEL